MKVIVAVILLMLTVLACNSSKKPAQTDAEIKAEIQKQLDKCVRAVVTKDINLYMDQIPEDFVIRDNSGEVITREKQKEYTLRDWAIIDTTLNNIFVADSIKNNKDSVLAYTSQRWERIMFRRDGKTKDTVLTTQKHIETWRHTSKGWLNYEVKELGGDVFINGKPYKPE